MKTPINNKSIAYLLLTLASAGSYSSAIGSQTWSDVRCRCFGCSRITIFKWSSNPRVLSVSNSSSVIWSEETGNNHYSVNTIALFKIRNVLINGESGVSQNVKGGGLIVLEKKNNHSVGSRRSIKRRNFGGSTNLTISDTIWPISKEFNFGENLFWRIPKLLNVRIG